MSNPSPPAGRRPFWCGGTGRGLASEPASEPVPPGTTSEDRGSYHAGPPDNGRAGGEVANDRQAPFGLPVLAEIPALAVALERVTAADAAMLEAVAALADLLRGDTVETTTGVDVEHWLAGVATMTRMDRRLLVRACQLLHRLPTLDAAVRSSRVSFAQLRGITIVLRGMSSGLDGQVDQVLSGLLDELAQLERPDPDVLVRQLTAVLDELDPADLAERERDAAANRYLALQPRLDGTGGRFTGDLDAPGLALLDAATAPTLAQVDHGGGHGAARADLLLARLAGAGVHTCEGGCTHDDGDGHGTHHIDPGAAAAIGDAAHPTNVDRDAVDANRTGAGADVTGPGICWRGQLTPPKLLLRLPFEALVDPAVPGELLTCLVGGRLRLTSAAARRLLDERGAALRTIIVDDGTVLGVGREHRQPPGWLTDTPGPHNCTDTTAPTTRVAHRHPPRGP